MTHDARIETHDARIETHENAAGVDLSLLRSEMDSLNGGGPVGRRAFMVGSVASGFAAAVAPTGALLAQTISTSDQGLKAGMVQIPAGDRDIPAYRAQPEGASADKPAPLVIVVQEIFGVHEHIRDVCRRFAKQGYCAVAPELYARQGDPTKYTEVPVLFKEIVSKVPDAQVMKDIDASVAWAAKQGGDAKRLGVTGFCWGGRIVWMYSAHRKDLKAGVAWYGRLTQAPSELQPKNPFDIAADLHGPVLGLYGGADQGIPVSTIDEMKLHLEGGSKAAAASKFHVYPEAPHAFHADYRPSYRKEAAEDGWKRCLEWFREHGVA